MVMSRSKFCSLRKEKDFEVFDSELEALGRANIDGIECALLDHYDADGFWNDKLQRLFEPLHDFICIFARCESFDKGLNAEDSKLAKERAIYFHLLDLVGFNDKRENRRLPL